MNRIYILFLLALMPFMSSAIVKRSIHVSQAGTLSSYISEEEKYNIEALNLTGNLNGTDFRLIRDMAGNNYQGDQTEGKLVKLDLTNAKIVAGGDPYLEASHVKGKDGRGVYFAFRTQATEDNVVTKYMFAGTNLESITLPTNITSIRESALEYCTVLKDVVIPNSVTAIESCAFHSSGIKSFVLPNSVTSINGTAFEGCLNLTSLKVESGNTVYDSRDKCNAIIETQSNSLIIGCKNTIIPDGVASIGSAAFRGCRGLTSITIPNSVTSIGCQAFLDCSDLTAVHIFDIQAWNKIRYDDHLSSPLLNAHHLYLNGKEIKDLVIPNNMNFIGEFAFEGCSGLTSVTIPNNVTSIGKGAFRDCSSLTSIKVESGNSVYDSRNNCNAIIETHSNSLILGCKNTIIPDGVTSIGVGAFYGCSDLGSINIPNSVTSIGSVAFHGCSGLTSVTIPDGVTVIPECAFEGCSGLTSVTIPSRVTYIGDEAFFGCSELIDVYCYAENVPKSDGKSFSPKGNATLYVPKSSIDAYKADRNWSRFNKIVGFTGSVKLSKSKAAVEKGKTMTLKATVTLPDKSVTWKSSNTKVATVTSSGKVKGVKAGTATITCTSTVSGAKATCKVTVGYVTLDKSEALVKKGKTLTLTPTVYPSSLTDKSVTWKSSDESIATVTSEGKVKGIKYGTATIICTSNATVLSTTCKVTVGLVKLDKSKATIEKGTTLALKATVYPSSLEDKSVTWKSSDKTVATVSSSGKVKGIKAGTATITCTSNATGLSATCKVTVTNGTVTLNKTEAFIEKGKTTTLKATLTPTTLEDMSVKWTSSDKTVATVSSSGKVKGVGYGTATITCTSVATGVSATCQVTIGKVVINMSDFSLKKTRTVTLKATLYPTTLEDKSVTWTSSDKSVATVTSSGKVKGIAAGTATITCTSVATGLKGTCTVTVLATSEARSVGGEDDGTTGIENIDKTPAIVEPFDVYSLTGRKVRSQVTTLEGLPNGIYIVNGKKVLKK